MRALWILALIATASCPARAQTPDEPLSPGDLKKLPLEQLFDLSVTLVSRRPEKLSETPSAIQVLTAEDIRRSGATHLVDALRLVSNIEVQQINGYAWVVSTRGFDATFANKLLVMIDGRSVYTPLHAGVLWDVQGVLLEDVDRIEVISGPGGTVWGANAVNGVINIITKSAKDSQGAYVTGGGGNFVEAFGAGRWGGRMGSRASYRVYGQRFDRNGTRFPNGDEGNNGWKLAQGGVRWDYAPTDADAITIHGDGYAGTEFNAPGDRSSIDGQNLVARWTRSFSETSALDGQVYVDRTWRRDIPSTISDQLMTYDGDVHHYFSMGTRHRVLWGLGFRLMEDDATTTTPFVGLVPERRSLRKYNAFLQDEVTLIPHRLLWTIGAKLERTAFAGTEAQPGTRLAWTPSGRHTVWSAVSRAVRAPSRIDVDYHIPKTPPYAVAGGPDFHSEELVAYEVGYRVRPTASLSFSLAAYYNHYDDLYSVELETPGTIFPYTIQNGVAGQSWGVELSSVYQPFEGWRLRSGYSYLEKDLWSRPGHDVLPSVIASLGNDPRHQAVLQSMMSFGSHAQLDATVRYVDRLPQPAIPSYVAVDVRVAFLAGSWELAVAGVDLTDKAHPEFDTSQEVPRSVHGSITFRR